LLILFLVFLAPPHRQSGLSRIQLLPPLGGTDEQTQRELNHNQVENHQLIFDIGINYEISRRWSVIADVPVF
jgi:hypothetical protein